MAQLSDLPSVLMDAGYERNGLARIGAIMPVGRPVDVHSVEELTKEPTKANILSRLWYVCRPVTRAQADLALGTALVETLLKEGLLELVSQAQDQVHNESFVRATCAAVPNGKLLMLRDFEAWATGNSLPSDHVLGVGLATSMLSDFTPRTHAALTLDIGTGQGFQATKASSHSTKVIATDINKRALHLAAISLRINAITNVELREGSLLEPVAGMQGQFNLIVSNPPFVIAPPHDLVAIGGRWTGDSFVKNLLTNIPPFLAEGGVATLLCNWHHPTIDKWQDRIGSWFAGLGVDAFIIKLKTDSAKDYAQSWLRETGSSQGPDGMRESMSHLNTWLEHYKTLDIGAVSLGVVYLRKRTSQTPPNWVRLEQVGPEAHTPDGGAQIMRIFEAQTLIAACKSPEEILSQILIVSSACEVGQRMRPPAPDAAPRQWQPFQSLLRHTQGFEFPVALEPLPLEILLRLDGKRKARDIIAQFAKELNADPLVAERETAPFIIRLLKSGHIQLC